MADNVSAEVDHLLREREKYETWLQRLEKERSSVSESAFERVQQDYRNRLEEVDRRLRAHSQSIHGRLEEVRKVLGELEQRRTGQVEDLEEARLRHSVGEYRDEDEWKVLEEKLQAAVQKTDQQLQQARQEIDRLTEILEHVRAGEAAGTGAEPAASATEAPPPKGPQAREQAAEGASRPGSQGVQTQAAAPDREAEAGANGRQDAGDEATLPDEEFGMVPPHPQGAPTDEEPAAETADAGEADELEDELAFLESLSLDESEDELDSLVFLEQKGRGQTQTVICPQCSAANDPAEWYCTECGEELPAE